MFWEVFNTDGVILNVPVNEKTIFKAMTEDFGGAENGKILIREGSVRQNIGSSNEMDCEIHGCETGSINYFNVPTSRVPKAGLFKSEEANASHCERSSPVAESTEKLLPVSQNIEGRLDTLSTQTQASQGRRCPSPLMFTPVKGEDAHGAGVLSNNAKLQGTPGSAEKFGSLSKNVPICFHSPSPKPERNSTSASDESALNIFAGMKRSIQHCTSDESNKQFHASSEFKVSRSEVINGPMKSSVPTDETHDMLVLNKLEQPIVSSSPSKCLKWNFNGTVAQIDSSPSPSKCSESSVFITPVKVERIEVVAEPPKPCLFQNAKFRTNRKHRLRTLVSRVKHSLSGIPPPPSFTIPQINVNEMLMKLCSTGFLDNINGAISESSTSVVKTVVEGESTSSPVRERTQNNEGEYSKANSIVDSVESTSQHDHSQHLSENFKEIGLHLRTLPSLQTQDSSPGKKMYVARSLFHPSATDEEIIKMPWPAVLDCVHLAVCYNLGNSSEALEDLCQQVREKYVGNETASSCTIWSTSCATKRVSPRQRKSSNPQPTTLARDGYLTRRRRAFSLASFSSTIPSMATKSRQILVNKVTKMSAEPKKNQKKVILGDNGKLKSLEDPKISLIKGRLKDKDGNKLKRSFSFNDSPSSTGQSASISFSESSSSNSHSWSMLEATKRVLKFDRLPRAASSPSLDACSSQTKLNTSILISHKTNDHIVSTFSNSETPKSQTSHQPGTAGKDLNEIYKKKLLWAVAEALRSRGLGTGHEKFKSCAIPLYRLCRDAFLASSCADTGASASESGEETLGNRAADARSNGSATHQKERTSDKMLNIALQLVGKVMNEVGVEPVVKDKGVLS